MTYEELQKLLIIDRNRLDDELVQQPQLYFYASEGYTDAAAKRDQSKLVLEQLEANLAKEARSQAFPEKVSDRKAEEFVYAHPLYAEQYERYLGYKSQAEKWDALTDSFRQRSTAIRDLVQLHTTGYWGSGLTNSASQTYAEKYKQHQALLKSTE